MFHLLQKKKFISPKKIEKNSFIQKTVSSKEKKFHHLPKKEFHPNKKKIYPNKRVSS